MKKALNNDLDKAVESVMAEKPKVVYKAYDYRKLTCGSCGTQMFADEAIHEVFCVNSRCNYIGFRFKAPVVRLERILEG